MRCNEKTYEKVAQRRGWIFRGENKMKTKHGKHLKRILGEMCKRVGANYDKIKFDEPEWFYKHSWTQEEQEKFTKWMIDYLKNNSDARREIMNIPTPHLIDKAVRWFVFDYSWKLKEEKKKEK